MPARRPTRSFLLVLGLALIAAGACEPRRELPPVGTEAGRLAPELEGATADGDRFRLGQSRRPRLVLFYRGGYCGLCRLRLQRLEEALPGYRELEVEVVGVSPEAREALEATARATGVSFPLVSVDSTALARWGVRGRGDPQPAAPVATFLLDEDGVILFAHQGSFAAERTSDAALLALLKERR